MTQDKDAVEKGQTSKRKSSFNLEKSLDKLEEIVTALEGGDLSLDQAMKQFEQGVRLSRECQESIDNAQQRILELTETDTGFELGDFKSSDK